ncbi:serine--tRNA ligase [Campylobacter sp. RM12640]|uniref:serine--tRNA ligase n=1 Tax=unclassified Campylobacter TaxID=2593542 RepID=UPI001BDB3C5F|nr:MULTISPECIES: serine--tRNA ligase [unclassified Campylobacter]MBT0881948.1 serine--tRNA ligase [Campylobacter sp. 2018MI13]MBZ7981103.1 serine--tRNA ligase [Campylobacter sp. RM12640]MBZ7989276.1 serine--tRNA ligase [Campylobacter sp. RM12635]ULO03618.1 seryl-tRNA synthetase [Campylobacter sp. RM12651]
MIDLRKIEENYEVFNQKLKAKKVDDGVLKSLLDSYNDTKALKIELENAQSFQNKFSKEMGLKAKSGEDISELKKSLDENKKKIAELNEKVSISEAKLNEIAACIPNLIADCVPIGNDEEENVEIKKVLTPPTFNFTPKDHHDLGVALGWLDFERGVKVAKSRFVALRGEGARLERALYNYMIDFNRSRGFEFVNTPYIVNANTMFGTGQLPKFKDDLFKIDGEELYLIPTSEVSVTNLYNDEIIALNELPIKMTCYSPCFRKEAGSAGRDTKGIIRQHQFGKVELVSISTQEDSDKVFEDMLSCASDLLTSLGLAHRHLMLCSGDLGFSAGKTVDLEVWLPAQNKYREISSVSNCYDFQARRAKIRYKDENGKNKLAHTLNGSSLAVGRTLVAIMENYQREDGTIAIPEVLQKYM